MDQEHERLSVAQGMQLCRLRDESARPWSYVAVAMASFVLIAAATIPTPLYQLYQESFHFSEFMLTMIFGVYAFGVIPALLVFGPLGDIICRRRVLMLAIGTAGAGIRNPGGRPDLVHRRTIPGTGTQLYIQSLA
jgi:MFS family permease